MSVAGWILELATVGAAYLLASIPTGLLIARFAGGGDVRTVGSGSSGTTNVWRVVGFKWSVLVFFVDFGKGMVIMIAAFFLIDNPYLLGLTVAAIIAGHSWPIWAGFKGGKGALVGMSSQCVLYYEQWWALIIIIVTASTVLILTKTVSIMTFMGVAAMVIFVVTVSVAEVQPAEYLWGLALGYAFILFRHKDNLRRLIVGKEYKIST